MNPVQYTPSHPINPRPRRYNYTHHTNAKLNPTLEEQYNTEGLQFSPQALCQREDVPVIGNAITSTSLE